MAEACSQACQLFPRHYTTWELLHNITEKIDYGQFKDLISDRSRWRQDSK